MSSRKPFAIWIMILAVFILCSTAAFAQDGTLKWAFPTGDNVPASPAIGADGTIYVGGWGDNLYAINPNGTQKWACPSLGAVCGSSLAIGADGTIYVGSFDNNLYAINPNGTQKWAFPTGAAVLSSPAIGADGTIYVGSYDTHLYAINPNGTQKWAFPTSGLVHSSPAIGADGTIYVGAWDGFVGGYDNNLYAINPNGTQKWAFSIYWPQSSPAIGADGTIYIGSYDAHLYAINPNGTQKWAFPTSGYVHSSPAIGADGTIYVGSDDSHLYAINPNGTQKWAFQALQMGEVHSSPAIGADGTIYVGSWYNVLAINGSSGGLATSPWPMFRHDLKHTGRAEGCSTDSDSDGYGDPGDPTCPGGSETDCNDANKNIYPTNSNGYCNCEEPYPQGTTEVCTGGIDEDCDGLIDAADPNCGTGLCDPDPCQSIPNAVADTCTEIAGSCTAPSDFFCSCVTGYTWQGATHTCEGQPPEDMAQIPAGCFDMGDSSDGCVYTSLCPVHNVCISAFEMDVHEVTNAEYAECVAAGGCTAPQDTSSYSRSTYYGDSAYDDFPVIYVDWYQAKAYCTWAGKRLPSEAEWEYAARGGLAGKRYPWGDTISGSDANYYNSGDPWDNDTSEVQYYAPNGYGLYDVAGNVWEWVEDDYHGSYDCDANPEAMDCEAGGVAPTDGSAWVDDPRSGLRVVRGGSWEVPTSYLWVALRTGVLNFLPHYTSGFRCAR